MKIMTQKQQQNFIEELGHKNLPVITNKYDPVNKKHRYELVDKPKKQPNRRFLHSDLALKIIMDCRTDESCNLKRNLAFRLHDVINTKEQTVINSIKDAFEGANIQTINRILGNRIDLYFRKHKLAIQVDELAHAERNLRINPDEKKINIFKEIKKLHRHIKKSNQKLTKTLLIDNLSKRIKIQVKSINKIEVFKMDCQTNTVRLQRMKNTQSKIKPIKRREKPETKYCLRCKDYANNLKSQEVKMTNKKLREKSNCIVC